MRAVHEIRRNGARAPCFQIEPARSDKLARLSTIHLSGIRNEAVNGKQVEIIKMISRAKLCCEPVGRKSNRFPRRGVEYIELAGT